MKRISWLVNQLITVAANYFSFQWNFLTRFMSTATRTRYYLHIRSARASWGLVDLNHSIRTSTLLHLHLNSYAEVCTRVFTYAAIFIPFYNMHGISYIRPGPLYKNTGQLISSHGTRIISNWNSKAGLIFRCTLFKRVDKLTNYGGKFCSIFLRSGYCISFRVRNENELTVDYIFMKIWFPLLFCFSRFFTFVRSKFMPKQYFWSKIQIFAFYKLSLKGIGAMSLFLLLFSFYRSWK